MFQQLVAWIFFTAEPEPRRTWKTNLWSSLRSPWISIWDNASGCCTNWWRRGIKSRLSYSVETLSGYFPSSLSQYFSYLFLTPGFRLPIHPSILPISFSNNKDSSWETIEICKLTSQSRGKTRCPSAGCVKLFSKCKNFTHLAAIRRLSGE